MMVTQRLTVTGHYAGAVSRAVAASLDIVIVIGSFTAAVAGIDLLSKVVFGVSIAAAPAGPGGVVALVGWAFVYVYGGHAIAGRTVGKGIVGLRVVGADGAALTGRQALARTLAFPLSGLVFGLGFAMIIVQREHRALHDLVARTAVVYDWGGRQAEVPGPLSDFLSRRAGAEYSGISRPT